MRFGGEREVMKEKEGGGGGGGGVGGVRIGLRGE